MLRRAATLEQVRWCREFLEDEDMGQRGVFDGDDRQQLFGLLAQVIVGDLLGCPRPEKGRGFDGGVDIEYNDMTWDVKCVLRNVEPLVKYNAPVPDKQKDYDVDGYVFVSHHKNWGRYNEGAFYIMGWLTKKEFFEQADYVGDGGKLPSDNENAIGTMHGHGSYFVTYGDTHRIRELEDLKNIGRKE